MAKDRTLRDAPPRHSVSHSPWREIAWVLLFKLAALTVYYVAFFAPTKRLQISSAQFAAVLGASSQTQGKQ